MNNDNVFFATEGYVGEKLTNTSANYIANLAKESCQNWQECLNSMSFYNAEVSLIGTDSTNAVKIDGMVNSDLKFIEECTDKIAKAHSLIAWLREAIKTKDKMLEDLTDMDLADYCKKFNIEYPDYPDSPEPLTEKEYYQSLSIKERNEYYSLQAEAAVIGKVIHPTGSLSKARNKLKEIISYPNKVEGNGRDTIIYTYKPTVDLDKVEDVFFELQQKHRAIQARLNGIKHNCGIAINESTIKATNEYATALAEARSRMKILSTEFHKWKTEEAAKIRDLKIIIPNSLKPIYEEISKLGK